MIGRLNHVAIAVPDLEAAGAQYRDTLGARVTDPVDQPAHGVTVVFVELPNTKIELLHPLGDAVQNLAHVPAYGFLAILWIFNLGGYGVARFQTVVMAGIIAFLYGVFMELVQTQVPGRYPSVLDCFLNVAGILIATSCYVLVSSQGSISWFRLASRRSKL